MTGTKKKVQISEKNGIVPLSQELAGLPAIFMSHDLY